MAKTRRKTPSEREKMSPVTRQRLELLEEHSRQWAVLIAHGRADAAMQLTVEASRAYDSTTVSMQTPIKQMGFADSTLRQLRAAGINTVGDFLGSSDEDLAAVLKSAGRVIELHRRISRCAMGVC